MTKKYKVKITRHAQKDFGIIWHYIAEEHPINAIEFIDELEEKILGLVHLPERHPVIPEGRILQTGEYRHLVYKNYRVIYRFDAETVYILRIFHGSKLLDATTIE